MTENRTGKTKQGKEGKLCNRWWNKEIDKARRERPEYRRACRRLRKRRHNSDAERTEFEEAWEKYRKKQVKILIRKAKVVTEREMAEELRAKGEEGGRNWCKLLR